jgi:hypothetical protein
VNYSLGRPFAVEGRHLFLQLVILHQ